MSFKSLNDHIEDFRRAMYEAGVPYSGPIEADSVRRRIYVEGDRKDRRNGWYLLHGDGTPAGAFGTWKGGNFRWKADSAGVKPMTRQEREEERRRREERAAARAAEIAAKEAHAKAFAQEMWDKAKEATSHPYLTRKGVGAYGLRVGEFWKERREDGKRFLAGKGALLIPMRNANREIVSLQAIYAAPVKVGEETRDKDFVFGGQKLGVWTTIGKPTELAGRQTIGICEGYATGASVHEATGLGVVVAFDAGNLLAVAREVRRLMPDARLVFFADNDLWTVIRDEPVNVGLVKARAAAADVGGDVVAPAFADVSAKPTDWNDLHAQAGLEEVRRQILAALDPQPDPAPEPEPDPDPAPWEGGPEFDPTPPPPPRADDEEVEEHGEEDHFTVCGHDHTHIYIYQHRLKLVVSRGLADWSEAALTMIAPLHWWEANFPGEKGFNKKMAVNWLQRKAEDRGFYNPNLVRGRGAWRDDGRFVFHFGNRLWVDGRVMDVTEVSSQYLYEQGAPMREPAPDPLSSGDGKRLFEAFQLFSWTRPASAILAAGWAVLAPVGGALRWRPHVWITGGAGSGKSTILEFVHWLQNGTDVYAQGNSTEAGVRQTLGRDSRGVVLDESEQNNDKETNRIQGVLALARQSSTESEAETLKGSQNGEAMRFHVRSMFMFGSIQVGIRQQADVERIAVLSLRSKKEGPGEEDKAAERWQKISSGLAALQEDPDLPSKLLARTLRLLPTIDQNVKVFSRAAAEKFGSQREGDQYGALLAGAWSLVSTKQATLDEARAMIERYDWSDYLEGSETEESDKALATVLGRLVRVRSQDVSIYELVMRASRQEIDLKDVSAKEAERTLKLYGMKIEYDGAACVENGSLFIAYKNAELDALMAGTPYASDIKGQLLRVNGATRTPKPVRFMGGTSRAVILPLSVIVDGSSEPSYEDPRDPYGDNIPF